MPAHTKLWYFERFRMISALSPAQRNQLEKLTRMLEVKRGTRIYLPGDPSAQIFLLKSGVIKISMITPDHRDVILTLLHAGDFFGERAVLRDPHRFPTAGSFD